MTCKFDNDLVDHLTVFSNNCARNIGVPRFLIITASVIFEPYCSGYHDLPP